MSATLEKADLAVKGSRMPTDEELLREFARTSSDDAFAPLVARHVHWVYSAALRQTRDPTCAEDATQAVFTALARKAGSLSSETIISGWLFRAVRYACLDSVKLAARRRTREWEAMKMDTVTGTEHNDALNDAKWAEIAPLLDPGLESLGETDRTAILLRYYEQKGWTEIGEKLGVNEDAARVRVNRALEKLRGYFSRRGVVVSLAIVAGLLVDQTVQAAPPLLVARATSAAIATGAASVAAEALARRLWRRAVTRAGAAVLALLLVGGLGVAVLKEQLSNTKSETTVQIGELAPTLSDLDRGFILGDPDLFLTRIRFRNATDRGLEMILRQFILQAGAFQQQAFTSFRVIDSPYYSTLDELMAGRPDPSSLLRDPGHAISHFAENRTILLIKDKNSWKWDFFEGLSPAQWRQRSVVLQAKTAVLASLTDAMRNGRATNLARIIQTYRETGP